MAEKPASVAVGKKPKEKSKLSKLDTTRPNDVKEKTYVTKQVDSSIAILDSPEDDVVLEALLYLSKYADLQINNLNYLQQLGLLQKLLNLFNRNVCILRLALRLLGVLLTLDDIMVEIDQDVYDDKILEISQMYITHTDPHVKQFCISTLSKLAASCRINCLIFKIDLFNPILDTIQHTDDVVVLEWTLQLLLRLLNAPAALGILPDVYNFDISILLKRLESSEKNIALLSYQIIHKLSVYCLDVFQRMFREAKLIETMLEVVMNNNKKDYHQMALEIICNSMKSSETSHYFAESLEFLKFCQWVKTCDPEYFYPCISILEALTKIVPIRQMLFDLSVEDSILHFLRSTNKKVLNRTCEAISNMTSHKYCCEAMLTPVVLKELFFILMRKDGEDPHNEVALKTIFDFSRRNFATMDMIHSLGFYKILLSYFKKDTDPVSEESFLRILEMLYKLSMHPEHQQDIVSAAFFEKLLHLFQTGPVDTTTFTCEILTNFVSNAEFRRIFLHLNGPQVFVGALQTAGDMKLLKNVLIFIYSNTIYENVVRSFVQNNLVTVLKEFPEHFKLKAPIIDKILSQVYNMHLPLKLFETNRLDLIDKLDNKFYVINGEWKSHFPFLEIIEASHLSTLYAIYVVDYTYEVVKYSNVDDDSVLSEGASAAVTEKQSEKVMSNVGQGPFQINYGGLSPDPFLPRYIYHVSKYLEGVDSLEEKIVILAKNIDDLLCGPKKGVSDIDKVHTFKLHVESIKHKLGTSMIPIGFLRLGFHCERALLFKAIADKCCIPASLVKGRQRLYWNEIALIETSRKDGSCGRLRMYVVDLMNHIGSLLPVGSSAANEYCNLND